MNPLPSQFELALLPVGWALVHFVWQGALIALGLAAVLAWLPQRQAALRYGAACVALALLLVTPFLTAASLSTGTTKGMSPVGASVFSGETGTENPNFEARTHEAHAHETGGQEMHAHETGGHETHEHETCATTTHSHDTSMHDEPTYGTSAIESVRAQGPPSVPPPVASSITGRAWTAAESLLAQVRGPIERNLGLILVLWMAGVGSVGAFHLRAWFWTRSLRVREVEAVPRALRQWTEAACAELGIGRPVQVLFSRRVDVPLTLGWLRPVILLPVSAATGLSREHLEALLWHELAHIRRHDYLVNLAQVAVETLFFYHPVVWWVSGQVRQEREHCCDDVAAREIGSRSEYVASLAAIEILRAQSLRLAMRANGGSLLQRVQRLAALDKANRVGPGWILPTLVVPALLLTALGLSAPRVDSDGVDTRLQAAGEGDFAAEIAADIAAETGSSLEDVAWNDDDDPDDKNENGRWQSRSSRRGDVAPPPGIGHPIDEAEVVFGEWTVRESGELHHWIQYETWDLGGRNTLGSKLDEETLAALEEMGDEILLRREAGTFHLEGRFDALGRGTLGRGDFTFYPNPDYVEDMEGAGVRGFRSRHHFSFAAADITVADVHALEAVGYGDLRAERVLEFAIHGVTPDFISSLASLGYEDLEEQRLLEFAIHGVDAHYVEAWQENGIRNPRPSELLELKIHGVDPQLIDAFREIGLERVPVAKLVEMTIHGVTPAYIIGLARAGFEVNELDRVVATKIHGVTPAYVMELREAGINVRDLSQLVEMKIHGVDPRFAAALVELGYDDVRPSTLVELQIHGVNANYIHDLADLGYKNVELGTLREMKIHGVTPGYIERLQERGYDRVSPRRLIEMKIHGVGH